MSLGNRAAILTLSRLCSYGLMLLSPLILVRLLSVEDFGRYRQFLLYGALLQAFAAFSIHDTLLYFIPAHPQTPWRTLRQNTILTFVVSCIIVLLFVAVDLATGGVLAGNYLLPLAIHTLAFVNIDFWEFFLLARHRPVGVLVYSLSRLLARMLVAVVTAVLTRDVMTIIWALVAFEVFRMIASAIAWRLMDRSAQEPPLQDRWRELLRFCLPSGGASLVWMAARNLSDVVVVNAFGAARFAQYTIGRYAEPIVLTLRNSISSVVLPEMVRKGQHTQENPLALWQRGTAINAILLLPMAVLLVRYAEPLIVFAFGPAFQAGAIVMQIYCIVLVRESVDFPAALRAANRADVILRGSVIVLAVCAGALFPLLPALGIGGAMLSYALADLSASAYLGWRTHTIYRVSLKQLLPWSSLGRIFAAAALSVALIANTLWTDVLGIAGVFAASAFYVMVYAALLIAMRVPEAVALLNWSKRTVGLAGMRRPGFSAAGKD